MPEPLSSAFRVSISDSSAARAATAGSLIAEGGLAFSVALNKAAVLEDGDALRLDDGRLVAVRANAMAEAAAGARWGSLQSATTRMMTLAGMSEVGDVLGLIGDDVLVVAPDQTSACTALVDLMLSTGGELVTVLAGVEVDEAALVPEHVRRPECSEDELVADAVHLTTVAPGHGGFDQILDLGALIDMSEHETDLARMCRFARWAEGDRNRDGVDLQQGMPGKHELPTRADHEAHPTARADPAGDQLLGHPFHGLVEPFEVDDGVTGVHRGQRAMGVVGAAQQRT